MRLPCLQLLAFWLRTRPGRISGLFSRRGYNIESITAGVTADPRFTRITIVTSGDDEILDQIEKQVEKLVDVRDIKELEPEIVDFADLNDYIDQPVRTYSSGMKARLGFAINVSIKPEILIVDEALSVGDSEFKKKCLEKINQIVGEKDVTFLFVTHSTGVAKSFCKRGMVMRQGKLLFDSDIDGAIDFYKKTLEEDEAKKKKGKGIFEQ